MWAISNCHYKNIQRNISFLFFFYSCDFSWTWRCYFSLIDYFIPSSFDFHFMCTVLFLNGEYCCYHYLWTSDFLEFLWGGNQGKKSNLSKPEIWKICDGKQACIFSSLKRPQLKREAVTFLIVFPTKEVPPFEAWQKLPWQHFLPLKYGNSPLDWPVSG